ncbi:pyridoxamine 5'-phosphate oxidase family protein [Natronorubrum daqingense]|uniref:Pyridoxamine 5'-phosphate oxidase n=1 Tax=Natronorubrum daqingense TaxID=588898 RepID=A0A1P8R9V2_9EURY|nr:pyridoxamine 5'-phosphate oxidase family protein [Natronorubrum daqingense]APX95396.1 pyridoxamine 5'-phosphate oxidase [Natronorubrum daqingense]
MTVSEEIERLLEGEVLMAHLATSVDDRPHVAPVWYRYLADDEVVEIVTTGRKLSNIEANPRVALSIQSDDGGEPQWMVTLRGSAGVVDDDEATTTARRAINEKYGAEPDAYDENTLVRIDIASASSQTYSDES